jgi:hypothetical protein
MSSSTCDQNPYWSLAIHLSSRATVSAGSAETACRAVTQRANKLPLNMPRYPLESSTSSAFS